MASVSSLHGGVQLCFHGNFKAPRPSTPSCEGLLQPQETQVVPREVPFLYPGRAGAKMPSIMFPARSAVSPRDRLTLSIDKTLRHIARALLSLAIKTEERHTLLSALSQHYLHFL